MLGKVPQRALSQVIGGSTSVCDVVIVGGGVMGSSIALQLGLMGYSVTVVDKNLSAGHGSTSYSSGICRMFYSIVDSVNLAYEGYNHWTNLRDFLKLPSSHDVAKFRKTGGLMISSTDNHQFFDRMLPALEQSKLPFQYLSRQELELQFGQKTRFGFDLSSFGPPRRIDDMNFGEVKRTTETCGVYMSDTGYVADPQLATENLKSAAEMTNKVKFRFNSLVRAVTKDVNGVSGVILENGDRVASKVVINAAGPHSHTITSMAFTDSLIENDMKLTTRPLRQEVAHVQAPKESDYGVDGKEGPMVGDLDTGIYFRPEVGNKILVGGIEAECDPVIFPKNADDVDLSLTDEHTTLLYRLALRIPRLQLPRATESQGIVACYDVTEDWAPIYDQSSLSGYYMAIGTSGNQFKTAPVVGRLMATLIDTLENDPSRSHDNHPVKLRLHHALAENKDLNIGSFSRKRDVHNTSNSVLG